MSDESTRRDRLVAWLREANGTEFLGAALGGALGVGLVYAALQIPPLGIGWGMAAVYGFVAFMGASAGWDYLSRDTDIATVHINGLIKRDPGAVESNAVDADEVCDLIREADDGEADSLLVEVNSQGGEPVPSEDIRRAIKDFDGPVVASAGDVCASGGYLIASGADAIVAREGGLIGSIGVRAAHVGVASLVDRLGIEHESLAAGEMKDAGDPMQELDAEERDYLQGLIDEHYDLFVERVADERDLDETSIRDTEARVFSGRQAVEMGLADRVGDLEDAHDMLAEYIGRDVDTDPPLVVHREPNTGLFPSPAMAARRVAAGAAAGLRDHVDLPTLSDRVDIELRFRGR